MEVTAVCLSLVMNVLILLASQVDRGYCSQKSDTAVLHVDPSRLQHFEYDLVVFDCVGLGGSLWRVMRRISNTNEVDSPDCKMSNVPTCSIENAYAVDSGEYWCENEKAERGHAVNITVTAGSVILESPVLPVMEGDDVTLRCKTKTTLSSLTAGFYKDGVFISSSSTREMTIHNVSKSDEGFYKCSFSDSGASPESWLAVRGGAVILESPVLPVMEGSDITLRCKTKTTSSNLTADFYRDGLLFGNSSTGEMTIHNVSKSDEGFYTCRISGFEESSKSWLHVKETTTVHTSTSEPGGGSITTEQEAFDTDVQSSPSQFTLVCVTVVLAVLVLVVALLHCGKHRVAVCLSSQTRAPKSDSGEDAQTDSGEASVATPTKAAYSVVTKHITKKDENDPDYYTLCPAKSGASSDSAGMSPSAVTSALLEDRFYSTIQQVAE